ncbi:MAG: NACHT domain-containing protein [Armatimonadetes bacterium]|nr:NACHT domain-containing protein [Armatimonadota bacterium]
MSRLSVSNLEAQRLAYREAFRSLYGDRFQSWFEECARCIHEPGDFLAVRQTRGDGGLDGLVVNSQLVYQVYAPIHPRDSATAKKITSDFTTALNTLGGQMRAWTFVHNHPEAKLGKLSVAAINRIKSKHPGIHLAVLDIESLWEAIKALPPSRIAKLLGKELRYEIGDELVRDRYLDFLLASHSHIDPRGISEFESDLRLPIDEIYVSLEVERHLPFNDRLTKPSDVGDSSRPVKSEVAETHSNPVNLGYILAECPRLVILGAPGSGKTTILRYLVNRFSQALKDGVGWIKDSSGDNYGQVRMPIYFRATEYAEGLRHIPNLSFRTFLPNAFGNVAATQDEMRILFEAALAKGSLIILIDGLDEIPNLGERLSVADHLEKFASGLEPGNRIIVTSRVAGYKESRIASGFAHFNMLPMTSDQIRRFLHSWCLAREKCASGIEAQGTREYRAEQESQELWRTIEASPGVRRLATNPLMLTILALIYRKIGRLPDRRLELYEMAVQTLLKDWRLAQAKREAVTIDEREALSLLGPLAFWMHQNEPSGLVEEVDAHAVLCRAYAEPRSLRPNHPDVVACADLFLRKVREHTGLFIEREPGRYGFMHLTFEEYFAAKHLAEDFDLAPKLILDRRSDPRWEEVIRLSIAGVPQRDSQRLMRQSIWCEVTYDGNSGYVPSDYEPYLYRDLVLAAKCLIDCPTPDPQLLASLATQLADVYCDQDQPHFNRYLEGMLEDLFGALGDGELGKAVADKLLELVRSGGPRSREALEGLTFIGPVSEEVSATLERVLLTENPWSVDRFVENLGKTQQTTERLLGLLTKVFWDGDLRLKIPAASALRRHCPLPEEVIDLLWTEFRNLDRSWNHRVDAAVVLFYIGHSDESSLDILQEWWGHSDGKMHEDIEVFSALGKRSEDEACTFLVERLSCTDPGIVAQYAQMIRSIMEPLRNEHPPEVRRLVDIDDQGNDSDARFLLKLVKNCPPLSDQLIANLSHPTGWIQGTSAEALGSLRIDTQESIDALVRASKIGDTRALEGVIRAFGRIGLDDAKAEAVLLQSLHHEYKHIRSAAAWALSRRTKLSEKGVSALCQSLKDKEMDVRNASAQALGRHAPGRLEIAHALANAVATGCEEAWVALSIITQRMNRHVS